MVIHEAEAELRRGESQLGLRFTGFEPRRRLKSLVKAFKKSACLTLSPWGQTLTFDMTRLQGR